MNISRELEEYLKKYIRVDQAFGPPDASQITEPECAAALFDWQNSGFAKLFEGSHVIIGRRGSGKSAILSAFRGKKYLNYELSQNDGREYREKYNLSAKIFLAVPRIYVDADTPSELSELESTCIRRGGVPEIEILAKMWKRRIWLLIGRAIESDAQDLWQKLPREIQNYISDDDIVEGEEIEEVQPERFVAFMEEFLRRENASTVIAFDNIERYSFTAQQNSVLAGLCAATGDIIAAKRAPLDVKLCLPAEIIDQLSEFMFRPDKDLHKKQYLRWNAAELMHLAAERLKLYLYLYAPNEYKNICELRIVDRATLKKFWLRYLPQSVITSSGQVEDTFTYILRHTQLLPRQLLMILNNVANRSKRPERELFAALFEDRQIIKGIEDSEQVNCDAVLIMFKPVYPKIRELFDVVMPRLTRYCSYGDLQSVYAESAKPFFPGDEFSSEERFREFRRLMFSVGALGRYDHGESTSQ